MKIHGLQKVTLLDFPGRVACTVFLGGCDLRCPFCHNSGLLSASAPAELDGEALLAFLKKRRGLLDGVAFTGGEPLLRPELPALLEDCKSCVSFALTLGDAPEGLIRRASVTDRTRALLLDACASAACEQSCDDLQALLAGQFQKEGLFVTDRYSPGYGDLPLTLQPQLLSLLDAARQIGLTLTDTCLMTPRKSVTALFGLSGRPPARHASGCQSCSLKETCSYRKAGISCRSRSGS